MNISFKAVAARPARITRIARVALRGLWFVLGVLLPATSVAFPPAPPHTFYGMIRDELGNPLPPGASITLEAASGVKVYGLVSGLLEAGTNYRLRVPIDAGLTSDAYKATALNPMAPFKIRITIGRTTYLPIEMTHDFALVGLPGQSTLLNLTIGVDSNGDGLPDAWQRRINPDITQVKPGGDADGDGLSNLQEYLAGTYAYDSKSGFALTILGATNGSPLLGFTAIAGRTYTVLGSADLSSWTPVRFRLAPAAAESPLLDSYTAKDVRSIRVEVKAEPGQPEFQFFKLMLE